jgi:hypothetical protein
VDSAAGGRLRGVVLVAAALGALVGGGWWWGASAPGSTPAPDRAAAEPSPSRVLVNPDPGMVLRIDSATGTVLQIESFPQRYPALQADEALPKFSGGTVSRKLLRLGRTNTAVSWSVPARDGDRYLLQYGCVGLGELRVGVRGAKEQLPTLPAKCDGSPHGAEVVAAGGLIISAARESRFPIEVGVQLIVLPVGLPGPL